MYLSGAYLTFYLDKLFGLWGVLGLLMFFSSCFCVALYVFVPKSKMAEKYAEYLIKRGISYEAIDTGDQDAEVQIKMKLKKWVDA